MTEIEQAWAKLGLKPGASLREAMEAHRDLSAVWHPDRFPDNPRLQRRAAEERAVLDHAFAVIRAALAGEPPPEPQPALPSGDVPAGGTRPEVPLRPSLYEESLADRHSARKIPYGWIIVGLTLLAMAISLYRGAGRTAEPNGSSPATVATVEPPPAVSPTEAAPETGPAVSSPESPAQEISPEPAEVPKPLASEQAGRSGTGAPSEKSRGAQPGEQTAAIRPSTPPPVAEPAAPAAPPSETAGTEPPAEDSPVGKAFEFLRARSGLVDRLVSQGRAGDMEFVEWKPVRSQPPEYYIDVVVRREGQILHYIWAVDVERQTIRPLSQAARELEAGGPRPKLERPS
ncbi:MAG: hypothetical protein Kow001_06770 [Acidobacteriota bacterium]